MPGKPLVSVIVPLYNARHYIQEAIDSILAQTVVPQEVIIVDDGSTDGSRDIVQRLGGSLTVLSQANQGSAAARNTGIQAARGEMLAFLDADDVWVERKMEKQLAVFAAQPFLDLCFGAFQFFYSPDLAEDQRARYVCPDGVFPGFLPSTLLARKAVFDRVGLFDTRWRVGEFIDWYARAQRVGVEVHSLPDIVMKRRIHGGNIGIREKEARSDYFRILRAALDRSRHSTGTG